MSDQAQPQDHASIQITQRTGRSIPTFLLHKLLRPLRSQLLKFDDPLPAESPQAKIPGKARKTCNIEERKVNGIYIYDFTAKQNIHKQEKNASRKRIYYFSGGGWQIPASSQHVFMCAAIASRMPGDVLSLISYPLAPNCPAPKCFPLLCDLYTELLKTSTEAGETVIIAGDSAGGNLALCLPLHMLKDETIPAPAAIMALAPSTDLRRCNDRIAEVAKHDPLLTVPFIKSTAETWRGEWEALDARVSPLAADIQPFLTRGVAVHGATGTYDVLYPDAIAFRDKCAEIGIKGQWLEWEQQMHVWMLTARYGFRESKEALEWVIDVMKGVQKQEGALQSEKA